jgi:hypothetical protein
MKALTSYIKLFYPQGAYLFSDEKKILSLILFIQANVLNKIGKIKQATILSENNLQCIHKFNFSFFLGSQYHKIQFFEIFALHFY